MGRKATWVSAAWLALAALAPANAEEATMVRAIEAGSLHAGALDMAAYWTEAEDGALVVTATFRERAADAAPMRVVMALGEGDDVAFAMPGFPATLYRFRRAGGAVTVTATAAGADSAGAMAGL